MIINDKILKPFFIKVNDDSFDLFETIISGKDSKTPGKEYEKNIGYYSTLEKAIKKVAKLKAIRPGENISISEYIGRIEKYSHDMSGLLK